MNKLIPSKYFVLIAFFILSNIVTGCTTLQNREMPSPLSEKIKSSDHWTLNGQMGLQSENNSGSASLTWSQDNDQYHISLFGPLGLGSTQLIGDAQSIELINHQGQIFRAYSPEQLLQQQLGWAIPVSPLKYWIKGMPAPHMPAKKQVNSSQQLTDLTQSEWHVQYLTYKNNLPQLIQLENKKVKLKIFIHRWELH